MPKVYNKHKDIIPPNSIYVGRPTPFGNPYILGKDGDRETVLNKYLMWINLPKNEDLRNKIVFELRGRDLVCYCAPLKCHADVLLAIANA